LTTQRAILSWYGEEKMETTNGSRGVFVLIEKEAPKTRARKNGQLIYRRSDDVFCIAQAEHWLLYLPKNIKWMIKSEWETYSQREGHDDSAQKFRPLLITNNQTHNPDHQYLVNHTKRQILNFGNHAIHPLPLLVASSLEDNYKSFYTGTNEDLVGTWRNDLISVETLESVKVFMTDFVHLTFEFLPTKSFASFVVQKAPRTLYESDDDDGEYKPNNKEQDDSSDNSEEYRPSGGPKIKRRQVIRSRKIVNAVNQTKKQETKFGPKS
jgi:hypothetical protein